MTTRLILVMLFSAISTLFGAENGTVNLTPRATDKNSVRACGGDIEAVKTQNQFTRRYVFKGGELVKQMQFCNAGRIAIARSRYSIVVPDGEEVVAWISDDGKRGVIEGCINQFEFETPIPPVPMFRVPGLPTLSINLPPQPNFSLPPWEPKAPPEPQAPPTAPEHVCPTCVSIRSSYLLAELHQNSKPVDVWAEIQGGDLTDGIWTFNGKEVGRGLHIKLDPNQLYKLAGGKAGEYFLHFTGKDADGHVIACGLKGTPLKLEKKGRRWWWKLPLTHCVYTYGHDIKKWHGGPLAEKGACVAEVGVIVWAVWPEAAVVLTKTPVHVPTILP